MTLAGKTMVVGVSGGIAAYKSAELVRLLVKAGSHTHVMMTAAATQFITPLTFQALSQHPVHTSVFEMGSESTIGHIELADSADMIIIAPATANIIAKLAAGICDDVLTTVMCASRATKLIAPAMNVNMWNNPIVQRNVASLQASGMVIIPPASGDLACGYTGEGRLPEPSELITHITTHLS